MRRLQKREPSVGLQPSAGIDKTAGLSRASTTGALDAHRVRPHPHCFSHATSAWTHRQLDRVHAPRWPHATKGGAFFTTDSWLLFVRESSGGCEIGASRSGGCGVGGSPGQASGQPQPTKYSAIRKHVVLGTKRAIRHVSNRPTMRTAARSSSMSSTDQTSVRHPRTKTAARLRRSRRQSLQGPAARAIASCMARARCA